MAPANIDKLEQLGLPAPVDLHIHPPSKLLEILLYLRLHISYLLADNFPPVELDLLFPLDDETLVSAVLRLDLLQVLVHLPLGHNTVLGDA